MNETRTQKPDFNPIEFDGIKITGQEGS